MSVYAKDRKETATQYVITAQKLQMCLIKYLMNDKRVPKKWRYMLTQGAVRKVNELLDNVIASHNTFPNSEEKLALRKRYLQEAVVNIYQLENKLQCMIRVINSVTPDNLSGITGLMLDELNLLKKALKNVKLIQCQEV